MASRVMLLLCLVCCVCLLGPGCSQGGGCGSTKAGVGKANASTPKPAFRKRKLPLHLLKLPAGFRISVYADNVPGARSLARGAKGTIFVGTRRSVVYALVDKNNDNRADVRYTILTRRTMPNGVAFRKGSLFVAEVSRIIRLDQIEDKLAKPPRPVVVYNAFSKIAHHGWKFIRFGPDGMLYVPVGAPCNVCLKPDPFASITRMKPDGTGLQVFVRGVRNSVGFDWHPVTKHLWFTDNGRDWMGDNSPSCELNHAPKQGMHFGFPYCHGGNVPDPKYGKKKPCSQFSPPAVGLGPHVAPLGMRFYVGKMFPSVYKHQIFIAEHGSWNRSQRIGYRVVRIKLKDNRVVEHKPFVSGWLQGQRRWGRPVDLMHMPDGALLVSDDYAGVIYRISYKKTFKK